jgi:nijmegen breakage syndrome protein 1
MPEASQPHSLWAIRDLQKDGLMLALLPVPGHRGPYSVGRHESVDVRLDGDKAISRRHLELSFDAAGALLLKDLGAKFGTVVGGQTLDANASVALADGQEVHVGSKRLLVTCEHIGFCFSGLSRPDVTKVQEASIRMGGVPAGKEWLPGTSRLVMRQVKLTPKMLIALAHGCPIVSPEWVVAAAARTRASQPLPPAHGAAASPDHLPTPAAQLPAECMLVQPARRSLFTGRRFAYLPGGDGGSRVQNRELLQAMGASEVLDAPSADAAALSRLVASGLDLLIPENISAEQSHALAAVACQAGGRVYNVALVRLCLIYTSLDRFELTVSHPAPHPAPRIHAEGGPAAMAHPPSAAAVPAAAPRPPAQSEAGEAAPARPPALAAARASEDAGATQPSAAAHEAVASKVEARVSPVAPHATPPAAAPAALHALLAAASAHAAPSATVPAVLPTPRPAAAAPVTAPAPAPAPAAPPASSPVTGPGSPQSPARSPLPSRSPLPARPPLAGWRFKSHAAQGSSDFLAEEEPATEPAVQCDAPVLNRHGTSERPFAFCCGRAACAASRKRVRVCVYLRGGRMGPHPPSPPPRTRGLAPGRNPRPRRRHTSP